MHARIAGILRAVAVLALLLALATGAGLPARAQDDPTPTPTETPTPEPEGTLAILTADCAVDAEPPASVAILTDAELAEQPACSPAGPALVSVDGGEAFEAANGDVLTLPAGTHTLTEVDSGAGRDVDIAEGATATLAVVTFEVVAPTQTPTETPTVSPTDTPTQESATEVPTEPSTGEVTAAPSETATAEGEIQAADVIGHVTLVTHLCRQGIATKDDLDAVKTWGQQLAACPVVVLPQNLDAVSDNAVVAPAHDPAYRYDQEITYTSGSRTYTKRLAQADFTRAALCESDLGEDLNGAPNGCYDQSGYRFRGVPPGTVTVKSVTAPRTYTFLTGQEDPDTNDGRAIDSVNPAAATVLLGTTKDDDVTVHLFFAPKPIEERVTIVGHLCPSSIQSRTAFEAEGDVYAKLAACPSITLPDDAAPSGGETAGKRTFRVTIEDADKVRRTLSELPFAPRTICERDLPQSVDDDPRNDRCLDESGYVADGVAQGRITVSVTGPASGSRFLAAEVGPDPDDQDAVISGPRTTGVTKLDTIDDGNVVVHIFFARVLPTPTATPKPATPRPTRVPTNVPTTTRPTRTATQPATATPTATGTPTGSGGGATATSTPAGGGTGSIKVLKFVCIGDESLSRINVLAPGQAATLQNGDLGDATCQNANSQYAKLVLANGTTFWESDIPPIGVREITGIPATTGNQQHTFDDIRWDLQAKFKVEAGEQTVLVSLTYEPDDGFEIDPPPDIPEPNIGEDPPPLPPSANADGYEPPDEGDGESEGIPDPVEDPAADPFGNVEDEQTAEEVEADEAAQAELAKVDEGKDLPTVGTRRAGSDPTPLWLTLGGLGLAGLGLATRRRRRGGIG